MADDTPPHPPGLEPTSHASRSGRAAAGFFLPLGAALATTLLGFALDDSRGLLPLAALGLMASLMLHAWLAPPGREALLRGGFLGLLVGLVVGLPVGVVFDFAANFCLFCDPAPWSPMGVYVGAGVVVGSILTHLGVVWLKAPRAPARAV